jgi:hypothetical protein
MSIGPVIHLATGYIQSLFTGAAGSSSASNTASTKTPSTNADRISPFAQVLSSLQELEQSNPSQYRQVTRQVASNLKTASRSATAAGNAPLGSRLAQLSTDFNKASTSGQLPNVQDLAQAIGAGLQKG